MEANGSTYETLSSVNVNEHTEKKNGLTYLSWAWAWASVKMRYDSASFEVDNYEGKPYLFDENLGYIVSTKVTIEGQTLPMHLPVMDGANKAMINRSYEYDSTKWVNGKKVPCKKKVEKASMFDINKTIMRCLVKNLAMFGLGLYIYAGEDLPEEEKKPQKDQPKGVIEGLRKKVIDYLRKEGNETYMATVLGHYKKANVDDLNDGEIAQIKKQIDKQNKK